MASFVAVEWVIFITAGVVGFLAGCAGPGENEALLSARAAYEQVKNNPQVLSNAPVALQEAGRTLDKAEQTEDGKERSYLAYLAERRAQVASEVAQRKTAENEIAALRQKKKTLLIEARVREAERARLAAEAKAREAEEASQKAEAAKSQFSLAQIENEQLREELSQLQAMQTERGIALTMGDILFKTGKAELMPGAMQNLDRLAAVLGGHPNRNVLIEGFTDSTGGSELNLKLSRQRAEEVSKALISRGVGPDRITAKGYGEDFPVATNDTPAGRQLNRRVEVTILNQGVSGESVVRSG